MFHCPSKRDLLLHSLALHGNHSNGTNYLSDGTALVARTFSIHFVNYHASNATNDNDDNKTLFTFKPLHLAQARFRTGITNSNKVSGLSLNNKTISFGNADLLVRRDSFINGCALHARHTINNYISKINNTLITDITAKNDLAVHSAHFINGTRHYNAPAKTFDKRNNTVSVFNPSANAIPVFTVRSSFFNNGQTSGNTNIFTHSIQLGTAGITFRSGTNHTTNTVLLNHVINKAALNRLTLIGIAF